MRLVDIADFSDSLTNCETVSEVLTKLSKQPTIDPVEAAGGCYCRECRWGQMDDISTMHCHKYHTHKQPDGFCSDGQRKETMTNLIFADAECPNCGAKMGRESNEDNC